MADPITDVLDTTPDTAILREWQELWETPGHREALLRTLELLRALNERGLLDAARATFEGSDSASRSLQDFLAKSQTLKLARNLKALYELLAALDLEPLLQPGPRPARPPAPGAPASAARPSMGLLELRRRLKDPDVSAGLDVVLEALAQVGRARHRPPQ